MNPRPRTQHGTTLVVGVILLAMVTLLGLAGASTARVERLLAQNESFRENAAFAASAGIETVITHLVNASDPTLAAREHAAHIPGSADRFETITRFAGYELALPQAPGTALAGARFEITSSGFSGRARVREQAQVLLVVDSPGTVAVAALDCAPVAPAHCHARGELIRLAWQRIPVE